MNVCKAKSSTIIVLGLLIYTVAPINCKAQEWSRSGMSEIFGMVQTLGGDTTIVPGTQGDIDVKLDSTNVYGFGFGYNLNDHLNLNTDLLFGSIDIKGTETTPTSTSIAELDTNIFLWDVNLDYNILRNRLTPVVSGDMGFINLSGSVLGHSFSETNFSYNFGTGVRWDISDNLLIKAMYRWTWTELEDSTDKITLNRFNLGIAYMF